MKKELKNLFKTKKGMLLFLTVLTALTVAYLNLITLKGTKGFWIFDTGISYGTLLVSFIPMLIGDLLAEIYGWKKSFLISSLSYTVALIFTFILWGTTKMPGYVFGQDGFPVDAYNTIFGQQWSILIGSAVAYYLGIFFNAFVMGRMQKKALEKGYDNTIHFFARCILSTMIGQFIDNALFFLIAYLPNVIDPAGTGWGEATIVWSYIWQQILAAWAIEVVFEIVLFPLTKLLTNKLKNLEE